MLICLIIISVLAIACSILYVKKSGEDKVKRETDARIEAARTKNRNLAFTTFLTAYSNGAQFVNGKQPTVTREQLFAGLAADPNVYNVVFTWTSKKRNQTINSQFFLYDDPQKKSGMKQAPNPFQKEGITITNAYTSSNEPIMIATKTYPPADDDKVSQGGEITVMVKAELEQ